MRFFAPILLVCLLIARSAWCGPELLVHEPIHDFGVLYAEDHPKVRHIFTVQNIGDEPLIIHNVKASCGCSQATVALNEIAPGETTELSTELEFRRRFGKEKIRVTLLTNDPKNPAFDVGLSGHLVRHWEIEPGIMPEVVLSGTSVLSRTIRIVTHRLPGQEAWKVVEVESVHPAVTVELKSETTTPNPAGFDQTEWIYEATIFAASSPSLEEQASIAFKTDDGSYSPLVTSMKWGVEKDLIVRPLALELRRSRFHDRTQSESSVISIESRTGESFQVTQVVPPPGFETDWVRGEPATRHQFQVRIVGTGEGEWNGEGLLVIETDRVGEKRLDMRLRGIAEPLGPIFSADSTLHRMGTGYSGDRGVYAHEFPISNLGTRPLLLSLGDPGDATVEFTGNPILPGATSVVRITGDFTGREGEVDLGATLATNDETRPSVEFQLQTTLYPRWKFDPPVLEWKNVQPGTELKRTVKALQFIDSWEEPTKVGSNETGDDRVGLEVSKTRLSHGAIGVSTAETQITVTVRAGDAPGRQSILLPLFAPVEGKPEPRELRVQWNVMGKLRSRPSSLVFRTPETSPAKPEVFTLKLYSQDRASFDIESVEVPEGIEVSRQKSEGSELVYEVIRTAAFEGEGDLVFHTNLSDEPEFAVPVSLRKRG